MPSNLRTKIRRLSSYKSRLGQSHTAVGKNPPDISIEDLAQMSLIEYGRCRRAVATSLGLTASILDKAVAAERKKAPAPAPAPNATVLSIAPWEGAVWLEDLLDDIEEELQRLMVLPDRASTAIALWVMFAHCHDAATNSPILAIESPEKRCGKSTLMKIIKHLVPNALTSANISAAGIFRTVEALRPTLLLDEADTFLRSNCDIRGILNSGFDREGAYAVRLVGDHHEPRSFSTWCPKAIALIGTLPDTLQDRSIVIVLRRRLPHEKIERFSPTSAMFLRDLNAKAAKWTIDNSFNLLAANPLMPETLDDRARDAWRPLLAIADAAGGRWPTHARAAALELSKSRHSGDGSSIGGQLLANIHTVFEALKGDRISSTDLVAHLLNDETWPWNESNKGSQITTHWLARTLKNFDIRPRRASSANEYRAVDFQDAWRRYTPAVAAAPSPSPTPTESGRISRDWAPLKVDGQTSQTSEPTEFEERAQNSETTATSAASGTLELPSQQGPSCDDPDQMEGAL